MVVYFLAHLLGFWHFSAYSRADLLGVDSSAEGNK